MKKFKRLLAMVLAVAMVVGIVNLPSRAADPTDFAIGEIKTGTNRGSDWLFRFTTSETIPGTDFGTYMGNFPILVSDGTTESSKTGYFYTATGDGSNNGLGLVVENSYIPADATGYSFTILKGTEIPHNNTTYRVSEDAKFEYVEGAWKKVALPTDFTVGEIKTGVNRGSDWLFRFTTSETIPGTDFGTNIGTFDILVSDGTNESKKPGYFYTATGDGSNNGLGIVVDNTYIPADATGYSFTILAGTEFAHNGVTYRVNKDAKFEYVSGAWVKASLPTKFTIGEIKTGVNRGNDWLFRFTTSETIPGSDFGTHLGDFDIKVSNGTSENSKKAYFYTATEDGSNNGLGLVVDNTHIPADATGYSFTILAGTEFANSGVVYRLSADASFRYADGAWEKYDAIIAEDAVLTPWFNREDLLTFAIDKIPAPAAGTGEPVFEAVDATSVFTYNGQPSLKAPFMTQYGMYNEVQGMAGKAKAVSGDTITIAGVWKYTGDGKYYDFGEVTYKFNGSVWEEAIELSAEDAVLTPWFNREDLLTFAIDKIPAPAAGTGEPGFEAVDATSIFTYNGQPSLKAPFMTQYGMYNEVQGMAGKAKAENGDTITIGGIWKYTGDNKYYNFGSVTYKFNGNAWEEFIDYNAEKVTLSVAIGRDDLLLAAVDKIATPSGDTIFEAVDANSIYQYNGSASQMAMIMSNFGGIYADVNGMSGQAKAVRGDVITFGGIWKYTGDNKYYDFGEVHFKFNGSTWEEFDPTIVEEPMDEAEVTIYDLFELENMSQKTIPANANYNLFDLKQSSNVGFQLQLVDGAANEVIFTLAKQTANNVWVDSGYELKLVPSSNELRIITIDEATGAEVIEATASGIDFSQTFDLEFAVADMYKQGTTELVARRVYAKIGGQEVLSWLDKNLDRKLGTYSPAWAYEETVVESITDKGYELVSKTPNVQDISEVMDGLSKVSTKPGKEILVGQTEKSINNAIRFKVDLGTAFDQQTQEMKFCFSNNSIASMWALEESGYKVALRPGAILIQYGAEDTVGAMVSYELPTEEFILEIGTYDTEIQKDGEKVDDYARMIYAKVNDQEVISWADKNMNRSLGKNMWVYVTEDVEADLVSLTSSLYLIKEKVKVYDLFNTSRLSRVELAKGTDTKLGETKTERNIAFRSKVTLDGDVSEFKLALSKTIEGQYWDIDASGWQFWFRPTANQVFIGYGVSEYGALTGYQFPDEFVLEIGERDTKYSNGRRYAREIYIAIDGEEVLTYLDKDYSRKLGTYVTAYASNDGKVTLNSLTTKGYIPVEKNVGVKDFFDVSGYAQVDVTPNECTYLGEMNGRNSAVKMRVDMTKGTDEFKLAIGKRDKTTIWDIEESGYQFWFRPSGKQIFIGYGMSEYATMVGYEYPKQSFVLEVGSKDVYYENGKYYGYQVYVKIDGEVVTSWIDEDAKGRAMGKYIVAYGSANSDITLSTLYSTYELPVVYKVNGDPKNKTQFAEAQTTVVLGKPSKITVTTKQDPDYAMTYQGTTVGEKELTALDVANAPIGQYTYEAKAKRGDKVIVNIETKKLVVEQPEQVLDIYDVMGKKSITVEQSQPAHVGSTVDSEGRCRINTAVQMKVSIPSQFNQIRWSMFSDQSSIWGYNGFIVKLLNNKIAICYTATERKLAEFNCDLIKANTTLYVESGAVKVYENGAYKYDRYYVKVGETLESMELAAWFDSRERGSYGTTIAAYGMDVSASYTISSVKNIKTIKDVSNKSNKVKLDSYEAFGKNQYAVYYPKSVLANKPATISLYVKEGKKLVSLTVGGQNVISKVKKSKDGGYVYEIPSVKSDITFSYVIK